MVAKDYRTDVEAPNLFDIEEKSYELPDGSVIEINNLARYKTTEILFDPHLLGDDKTKSVTDMILDSLSRCDPEM